MLHILATLGGHSPWQLSYEKLFCAELTKIGYPFHMMHSTLEAAHLSDKDFLWVQDYQDAQSLPLRESTSAKIIHLMSATSEHPCSPMTVNRSLELQTLNKIVDINLVFHPRVAEFMQQYHPDKVFEPVGFPVSVPLDLNRRREKRVPKRIIIGGRLDAGKQFALATVLLADAVAQGYEVFFCTPPSQYIYLDAICRQDVLAREGFHIRILTHEEWLDFCYTGDVIFSCSLVETCCVSAIEAIQLGLYPVLPYFDKGLPVFDTYVSDGYEPFSKMQINTMLKYRHKITINDTWFNPAQCASRLINVLERYK